MDIESINDKYVKVLEELTLNMKAIIDYARENDEIPAECANKLLNTVDKFNTNVSMLLSRDCNRFFSLNVLMFPSYNSFLTYFVN